MSSIKLMNPFGQYHGLKIPWYLGAEVFRLTRLHLEMVLLGYDSDEICYQYGYHHKCRVLIQWQLRGEGQEERGGSKGGCENMSRRHTSKTGYLLDKPKTPAFPKNFSIPASGPRVI